MIRSAMRPILYYDNRSPPVRSCLMLVKCLGIDAELKEVDLFKQEHLSRDFRKVNPLHTVPTLQHDQLTLTDSHSILIYLGQKYGSNVADHCAEADTDKNVYPADDVTRIKIINRLFFECGILFKRDSDMMSEIFRTGRKDVSHHERKIHEAYDFMEGYLTENKFMACDTMTIADFSTVTTLSTVDLVFPVTPGKWPRLVSWFQKMQALSYYHETNQIGLNRLRDALEHYAQFDLSGQKRAD